MSAPAPTQIQRCRAPAITLAPVESVLPEWTGVPRGDERLRAT